MLSIMELYRQKLCSAENAVKLIPAKGVISMGMRAATPPALLSALAQRARHGEIKSLRVYYLRCGDIALKTIFQEDLLEIFHPYSSMFTKGEIELAERGFAKGKKYINFVPINFSRYPYIIDKTVALDAFLVTVSPLDKSGYFSFGLHGDYAIELSRKAKKLIVEVNENMPRTAGNSLLHISEVDAIVENTGTLLEDHAFTSDELDIKIGKIIAELIPDEATIQIGIGGVPNAVCLELTAHKNLGVHTEVLTPGVIELIKKGVITNRKKNVHPHQSVFTFAAGDKQMYDFLNDNPSMTCYSVSYVNEPFIIAQNDNMISVNSFIEIDFSGQVNAEFLQHQFSGVGGQLDFVRGAFYSKGGKTILASHSTTKDEKYSKIIPRITRVVTDTRLDVDYVVTEYGYCQLAGKSTTERTLALIELAHPKFRDELLQEAREHHFI